MVLLRLTAHSLWNRRLSVALTLLSIAISTALLLGVNHLREEAQRGFSQTVSGTDLIVGARTSSVSLLLYSVFHMGYPTNNIRWESYQHFDQHRLVAWTIPLSLGDSHRGYRVIGTDQRLFEHYRYGAQRPLSFAAGRPFEDTFEAVIGAEVARRLNYAPGQEIVIAHGLGEVSFAMHDQHPFTVVGILERTGTPIVRGVYVGLDGIEAIHVDWQRGAHMPGSGRGVVPDEPEEITAFLMGLTRRVAAFQLQRDISQFRGEPLSAILPGAALAELWQILAAVEQVLLVISGFVVAAGLAGMLTTLLAGLNERRREMAILRAVGARPWQVLCLLVLEALWVCAMGCALGVLLLMGGVLLAQPLIAHQFGLHIGLPLLDGFALSLLGIILALAAVLGTIPGLIAYRRSLQDGLTVRV